MKISALNDPKNQAYYCFTQGVGIAAISKTFDLSRSQLRYLVSSPPPAAIRVAAFLKFDALGKCGGPVYWPQAQLGPKGFPSLDEAKKIKEELESPNGRDVTRLILDSGFLPQIIWNIDQNRDPFDYLELCRKRLYVLNRDPAVRTSGLSICQCADIRARSRFSTLGYLAKAFGVSKETVVKIRDQKPPFDIPDIGEALADLTGSPVPEKSSRVELETALRCVKSVQSHHPELLSVIETLESLLDSGHRL